MGQNRWLKCSMLVTGHNAKSVRDTLFQRDLLLCQAKAQRSAFGGVGGTVAESLVLGELRPLQQQYHNANGRKAVL